MFSTTLKRIFRSGFVSFWRNGFVSVASIVVMIITLSVIVSTIFLSAIVNTSLDKIRNAVDVTVFFVPDAADPDMQALQRSIQALPEVSTVTFTSADDNLAAFKLAHANDQYQLQALDELQNNPLGATLNIRAKDPSQYEGIANFLQSSSALSASGQTIVDKVNYYDNKERIDVLVRFINAADKLGLALTIFFILISIVITYNTIRLAIFMAKDEIAVMRLVGASKNYIRGPFVVSGAMYGVVAAVFTLIIFWPISIWLGSATADFFSGLNIFSYYMSNFIQIFFITIFSGIVLGGFSSWLAARKYLKV